MSAHDWSPAPDDVRGLVLEAGELLREGAARRQDFGVRTKSRRVDLVTEMDHRLQGLLVAGLRERFPEHRIVAEEGEESDTSTSPVVWYVDPLDGTTNFVHGYPFVAISLGCVVGGSARFGMVYAPLLEELFWARRGRGAWLERSGRNEPAAPLSGSTCSTLEEALLATGFPYHRGSLARLNLICAAHVLDRCHGLRRAGSAALDLCYLAAGRLDGFWEMTLKPWDVAGAGLVAEEAGMKVTDFEGNLEYILSRRICAAPISIHDDLLDLLRRAHQEPERLPLGEPLKGPVSLRRGELDTDG